MGGKEGKREARRKKGQNKTRENSPIQRACGFLLVVLMQGLGGLSKALSPDCGTVKHWAGLGQVLRTKSLLRAPCPGGRGRKQEGAISAHLWEPSPGLGLLVYPKSLTGMTHTGALLSLRGWLPDARLYREV